MYLTYQRFIVIKRLFCISFKDIYIDEESFHPVKLILRGLQKQYFLYLKAEFIFT